MVFHTIETRVLAIDLFARAVDQSSQRVRFAEQRAGERTENVAGVLGQSNASDRLFFRALQAKTEIALVQPQAAVAG